MALAYDGAIQRLIDAFGRLPGIGPKGAQRIAFYMLSAPEDEARDLAEAIEEVKAKIRFCDICGNVCESSPCPVCADPRRDRSVICVVEEPKDVMSIERTREYRGLYHVLGGVINPMANVQPSDLNIAKLIERLKDGEVTEVILALNPNVEGEATTSFLSQLLSQTDIKVTRLASGLPVGGDLEYADEITLGRASRGLTLHCLRVAYAGLRWHVLDCASVVRAICGRFDGTYAEKMCGSHILFRMLGVQGLDKSDFSYN